MFSLTSWGGGAAYGISAVQQTRKSMKSWFWAFRTKTEAKQGRAEQSKEA